MVRVYVVNGEVQPVFVYCETGALRKNGQTVGNTVVYTSTGYTSTIRLGILWAHTTLYITHVYTTVSIWCYPYVRPTALPHPTYLLIRA